MILKFNKNINTYEINIFYIEILKCSKLSGKFNSSISSTISKFAIETSSNFSLHTTLLACRAFSGDKRTFSPFFHFTLENVTYNIPCIKNAVSRNNSTNKNVCPCALCIVMAKAGLIEN